MLTKRKYRKDVRIISGFVDKEFYWAQLPSGSQKKQCAAEHYLTVGADLGLDPSTGFSSKFYLEVNDDVAGSGVNPLLHYVKFGKQEKRQGIRRSDAQNASQDIAGLAASISAFVDENFYWEQCPKPDGAEVSAAEHYIVQGAQTGLDPSCYFSTNTYAAANNLNLTIDENPLVHFALAQGNNNNLAGYELARIIDENNTNPLNNKAITALNEANTRQYITDCRLLGAGFKTASVNGFEGIYEMSSQRAKHINASAKPHVLSLDIWDTILRRNCHPDEIKLRSARFAWLHSRQENSKIAHLHPGDFFRIRKIAEAQAANDEYEYKFSEAMQIWSRFLGPDCPLDGKDLENFEIRLEKSATFVDQTIKQVLANHKGRKICVSDFYMSAEQLAEILQHNKVEIDQVYASSDFLATKREGTLFGHILEKENLENGEIFHIGDRADSDFSVPKRLGIKAEYYPNERHSAAMPALEACFENGLRGDYSTHYGNILKLLSCTDDKNFPLEALAVALCGFGMRILEDAKSNKMDQIFFCTREGVFFKECYDLLVAQDVYDLGEYPESKILHVSRRATFAASLSSFSTTELMRLWSQYSKQSLFSLATTLNIDPKTWEKPAKICGIDINEVITYPWQDSRVQKLFTTESFAKTVQKHIWQQRQNLTEYLVKTGFEQSGKPKMMVDIGWRGTIQDNLAQVSLGDISGSYLGLNQFLNPQPENTSKSAFLFNCNIGQNFAVDDYAALEFLFNTGGGSVIGYQNGTPLRDIIPQEEKIVVEHVSPFQKRLLDAVGIVANYVKTHGLVAADLRELSRIIINGYMKSPPADVADAFANLEHNESFGTGTNEEMALEGLEITAVFKKNTAQLHGGLNDVFSSKRWPAGLAHSSQITAKTRRLLIDKKLHLPTRLFAPTAFNKPLRSQPVIAIATPEPIQGSGGHRTIYNMAAKLSKLGADVHLMSENQGKPLAENWMNDLLAGQGLTLHNSWYAGLSADIAIATIDYSAFFVDESYGARAETFYFIQDYEADFNPVSDTFLKSQRTYTQTDHQICVGRWLSHFLHKQFGLKVASGGLGVDGEIYRASNSIVAKKQVAFLYQPEKWRRAPQLCIDALSIMKNRLPDVEIIIYGSDADINLPFGATNRGLISSLDDLNRIYQESRVGLCISATNPSRIPFEMMSAGCVPVDIYRYNNLFDYGKNCGVLAYQSPESLAEAMCKLLEDDTFFNNRQKAGFQYTAGRSLDWETDVAANAIAHVLDGGDLLRLKTPQVSYSDAPIIAASDDNAKVQNFVTWQRNLANH